MNRSAATLALLPLSGLYGAGMRTRAALYRAGLLPVHRLAAPVISVGNITAGGTGKTPLVEWIARELAQAGRRVCILTRGYGRANPRSRVVVSNGEAVLAGVREAGDEPFLLAERLVRKAAVISHLDRVSAARWAVENLGSDVFVLDDGFQNLRVARNLNIVTIDATNPWSNGHILPAGLLREPRSALSRADCVVLTRAEQSGSLDALRAEIGHFGHNPRIIVSRMKTCAVRQPGHDALNSQGLELAHLAAFCAIGNSQSFFSRLRREGRSLRHTRAFPDHHVYSQADLDTLVRESRALGATTLITTAKDEVKLRTLRFDLPCYVLDIEIEIEAAENLRELIRASIHGA
jgi:tetraacyldisaccharide 4'-kinase